MHSSFLGNQAWISEQPILYQLLDWLGRFVTKRAYSVRTVSYGEKERLQTLFPGRSARIYVLPVFIDRGAFQPSSEKMKRIKPVKDKWVASIESQKIILFVGRLVKQKNLPYLFEAFQHLLKLESSALLAIAGEGQLREGLLKLGEELGISDRILWLGHLDRLDLIWWYRSAICTVLPSHHEGFGRVIVESYLCGTPVLATPFVSAAELIDEGNTGYIVPFDKPEVFSMRLKELLGDPQKSSQMGIKGIEWIENYFGSDEQYFNKLVDFWVEAAGK
jgi:glycosyltransferase involved in cell wall biosynthesis